MSATPIVATAPAAAVTTPAVATGVGIATATLTREFRYAGMVLGDPAPSLSPDQVRDLYAATYPELGAGTVQGPSVEGSKMVYTLVVAVGDKG